MNRHAGASFALSVLIVGFFAVILYQPDTRTSVPSPQKRSVTTEPLAARDVPPPTPGVPLIEATAGRIPITAEEPRASIPTSPRALPTRSGPGSERVIIASSLDRPPAPRMADEADLPAARDRPTPVQTASRRFRANGSPRAAFTQVGAGESLKDVAVRVYGNPDATRHLWMANRDIINDQNAPLRDGTLLRTP